MALYCPLDKRIEIKVGEGLVSMRLQLGDTLRLEKEVDTRYDRNLKEEVEVVKWIVKVGYETLEFPQKGLATKAYNRLQREILVLDNVAAEAAEHDKERDEIYSSASQESNAKLNAFLDELTPLVRTYSVFAEKLVKDEVEQPAEKAS